MRQLSTAQFATSGSHMPAPAYQVHEVAPHRAAVAMGSTGTPTPYRSDTNTSVGAATAWRINRNHEGSPMAWSKATSRSTFDFS